MRSDTRYITRTKLTGYLGSAITLAILCCATPLSAANFWNAKFLTSNSKFNNLKSPPAFDTSGSIVAVWQLDDYASSPSQVLSAGSTNNGTSWTVRNVRSTPAPPGVIDHSPVVTTSKSGQWLCVWSSSDSLNGTTGGDFDILFSQSTDAGVTWSDPQQLNSTGSTDSGYDQEPWVTMDEAGNCVAAWTSDNNVADVSATTSSQTTIWMARSSDAGATWTPAEPLPAPIGKSLSEPRLTTNGTGAFAMVWATRDGATTGGIEFSYTANAGTTWTLPGSLSGPVIPPNGKFDPAIAGDESGHWMVAWKARPVSYSQNTDIYVARSNDNGESWLEPLPLNRFNSLIHSLYTNGAGIWCLGIDNVFGAESVISVSRNFGETWVKAQALPKTAPSPVYYPYFIEPPESTPFIWQTSVSDWMVLYGKAPNGSVDMGPYQIRQATTTMPPVPPVSDEWSSASSFTVTTPVFGTEPDIAANDSNVWVATYVMPAPPGTIDTEIGFSRSTDGGRTWSEPAVLNTDAGSESDMDSRPSIAASDGSTWVCAWQRSGGKIWQARSLDHGKTWQTPTPVMLSGGTALSGSQPSIASLGNGQWIIAYSGGAIQSTNSSDDGLTWNAPVFVQSGWQAGSCGNTSPCTIHTISGPPRAFAAHGRETLFVGFNHSSRNRPYGYSGVATTYDHNVGHVSHAGGAYYEGNLVYSPYIGPSFSGTDEMATDGAGKWMAARRSRYDSDESWDISFGTFSDQGAAGSFAQVPDVLGRSYNFASVAMDEAGHEKRFWNALQAQDLAYFSNIIFLSESGDAGASWSAEQQLPTDNPWEAEAPSSVRVKGSATSSFVAVWQAKLPSGESVILYSANNKNNAYTAAKDWQLFD